MLQTFLPYPDFDRSAQVLDRSRLGKQRIEALQILRACMDPTYGFQHHPAVSMWRGHEVALHNYGQAICREWIRRGYMDTVAQKLTESVMPALMRPGQGDPAWLGDERFHRWHQSKLVRVDPDHYRPEFLDVPDDLEDAWPIRDLGY